MLHAALPFPIVTSYSRAVWGTQSAPRGERETCLHPNAFWGLGAENPPQEARADYHRLQNLSSDTVQPDARTPSRPRPGTGHSGQRSCPRLRGERAGERGCASPGPLPTGQIPAEHLRPVDFYAVSLTFTLKTDGKRKRRYMNVGGMEGPRELQGERPQVSGDTCFLCRNFLKKLLICPSAFPPSLPERRTNGRKRAETDIPAARRED